MIAALIRWSLKNRSLVLLAVAFVIIAGLYAMQHTPVDAIPDLSDVQVIIKTPYPGQAPQVVQDQVTYPLETAMLAVPGATVVRGRHGPVLGALAGAGISEPGGRQPAAGRAPQSWSGCHRRRLGVRIRTGGQDRSA
jgi:AcrB/AcrD/AcrF family